MGSTYPREVFMNASLLQVMPVLKNVIGGDFHGVLLHSTFWDIAFVWECHRDYFTKISVNPSERASWLKNWKSSASSFIKINKGYFNASAWIGWRTANHVVLRDSSAVWFSKHVGGELLHHIRKAGENISAANNIDLVDYAAFPDILSNMRDHAHPSPASGTALVDDVIRRTIQALE